jgi:hypothetical protein
MAQCSAHQARRKYTLMAHVVTRVADIDADALRQLDA